MKYEELEIGTVIGKGCSSVVLQAQHRPSQTPLALKVREVGLPPLRPLGVSLRPAASCW